MDQNVELNEWRRFCVTIKPMFFWSFVFLRVAGGILRPFITCLILNGFLIFYTVMKMRANNKTFLKILFTLLIWGKVCACGSACPDSSRFNGGFDKAAAVWGLTFTSQPTFHRNCKHSFPESGMKLPRRQRIVRFFLPKEK